MPSRQRDCCPSHPLWIILGMAWCLKREYFSKQAIPSSAREAEQPLPPRRRSRLPPQPVGSWNPAGEQSQAGEGTGKGSPALSSSLLKIQQGGDLNATTQPVWVTTPLLCHLGKLRHRATSVSSTVSPARSEGGKVAATGHWDTGLGFSGLELCTQKLYLSQQTFISFIYLFIFKADLCTQLVLIFQMGKIGLVCGNSQDISLICCFNLSLNFWTDFIDFFLFFFPLWKSPGSFFLLLANNFPPVLLVAVQVSQGCSRPRSQLV